MSSRNDRGKLAETKPTSSGEIVTSDDRAQPEYNHITEEQIKKYVTKKVTTMAERSTIWVALALGAVWMNEQFQLWFGQIEPADRVIDETVVIIFIIANAFQVGAAAFPLIKSIFDAKRKK